jgi:prepilin-type N-terminal cleavage/methylation domain-containing protein
MTAYFKKVTKGFTLIELLIVMAILGVLAVVVLVAINPVQQLARTRDAGRKSAVTQLGHALEAYYTGRGGVYPGTGVWAATLTASGELSTFPSTIGYSVGTIAGCTFAGGSNGYCLKVDGTTANVMVYARLESNIERTKCTTADAFFVFSTDQGRGGIACYDTEAALPATGVTFSSLM